MSTKMWEVTVDHAQTCILDPRWYFYYPGSQQKTGVVFSVVGQVMGLLSECQYTRLDDLSETEKAFFFKCLDYFLYFFLLFHSLSNPFLHLLFFSGGRP